MSDLTWKPYVAMATSTTPPRVPKRSSVATTSSVISSISLDSRTPISTCPDLRSMLIEYKLSVKLRPTLTATSIDSIVELVPKDLTDLRNVNRFGRVCRDVHGKKVISICRTYSKDLVRWNVSQTKLALPNSSSASNDVSTSSKIIDINSNTIFDFCQPSISDPINLKNTYSAKIRDFRSSFNVHYTTKSSDPLVSRPQRSSIECASSSSVPAPRNQFESAFVTRLLTTSCLKSRRFTIEDAMLTPPDTLVTIFIPMWRPSKKSVPGKEWTYITDKHDNYAIRLQIDQSLSLSTMVMNRLKYSMFKGVVVSNPTFDTINNGGLSIAEIKRLYQQRSGLTISLYGSNDTPCFWWSSLNPHDNKYPIMLWGSIPRGPRDFISILKKLKHCESKLNYFTNVYYKETAGDVGQTSNLMSAIEQCRQKKKTYAQTSQIQRVVSLNLHLRCTEVTNFFVQIDAKIESYLSDSMFKLNIPSSPLIPVMDINLLVIDLYHTLPQLYNIAYYQSVSVRNPTFDIVTKLNRVKFSQKQVHIGKQERYIFFRVLADARKRNFRSLKHFGIFFSHAEYCKANNGDARSFSNNIGYSLSATGYYRHKIEMFPKICKAIKKELSSTKDISLCMDNTHRIFNVQSQRGGQSSLSFKGTQRLAFQIPVLSQFQKNAIKFVHDAPALDYKHHQIRSMPGLPEFERVVSIKDMLECIKNPCGLKRSIDIDYTGDRVSRYQDMLILAGNLIQIRKNIFKEEDDVINVHHDLQTNDCRDRYNIINSVLRKERYKILLEARSFQANVTKSWNTTFNKPTKMLLLPFSPLDEMKKDEAGGAALELFDLCNLINIKNKQFELVDGWNDRLIIEHGDQKTVENTRAFVRELEKVQVSSIDLHAQSVIIRKLFKSTTHIPGAWHVSLKMICSIFKDHYATFIHPSQLVIGWKHIVSDPTDCYSAAVSLLHIMFNQLSLYFEEMFKRSNMRVEDIAALEGNESGMACIMYAMMFEKYLQSLKYSSDEVMLDKIHFYLKCRDFFQYRASMRLGDSLTEDSIFDKWKSLWYISGNNKYFSLCLDHIENLHKLDPSKYMRVQISRHVWLTKGNFGSWLAKLNALPVDEMIEFYNDWTKRLPKVKSMDAFIIATMFTMVLRQSMHCFNDNFGRYQ